MAAYKLNEYLRPVGSFYLCVNSINPASVFGGNWVKVKDSFFYCTDGETKVKGGEAEHTLTVEELPAHKHTLTFGCGTNWVDGNYNWSARSANSYMWETDNLSTAGGGKPHNNMPAYITVNVWYRVS